MNSDRISAMLIASFASASAFERWGMTKPVTSKVIANAKMQSTRASSLFLEIFKSLWSSIRIVPHNAYYADSGHRLWSYPATPIEAVSRRWHVFCYLPHFVFTVKVNRFFLNDAGT